MPTSVGIVVLNWNTAELTRACIRSLEASQYRDFKVFLIDNGSTDGLWNRLPQDFPDAAFVRNERNSGFAAAANQGLKLAFEHGSDYALLLNNDTVADPGLIGGLLDAVQSYRENAVASPKIFYLRSPGRLWFAWGTAAPWAGLFRNPAYNKPDGKRFDSAREMDWVVGCCLLIPKKVFDRVGGFDERFFAYSEDVDWSLRCRRKGVKLIYAPQASLWHWAGTAAGKKPAFHRYLQTRNSIWTLRKNTGALTLAAFTAALPARCLWRMLKAARTKDWSVIGAEVRGVRDGFFAPL